MRSIILTLLLLVATAHAKRLTDAELDKITQADIDRTKIHRGSLLGSLQARADAAEEFEKQTRDRLAFTQAKLVTVEQSAKAVEADRDSAYAKADKLEKENKKLVARNRTLSFIVGGELALIVLLACLKLGVPQMSPPWGVVATCALPVVAFGVVKFI